MEKLNRFMAKHPRFCRFVVILFFAAMFCGWYVMDRPLLLVPVLLVVLVYGHWFVFAACDRLWKKPLEALKTECDPYPFLEEIKEQQSYPGNNATKQIRTINYALALRCIGEYDQAFALLSATNIDKNAGMPPAVKVVYYNNLMDLCMLMGKNQEAIIWYEKTAQIFHDIKPGKQKEKLRNTVESNRATWHFCRGEYELALQALSRVKIEDLNGRIENAMMYAHTYLALGEKERATKPLEFVAENGNKLYFATEAKELLAKMSMEEQ